MAKTNSSRKTPRRAQQSTAKKTKQTASKNRQTRTIRPDLQTIDASKYEHWRLPTGFVLFLSDECGHGHMQYVEDASAYSRSAIAAKSLKLVKAWPISEPDLSIVEDALRRLRVGSGCYLREGPALAIERRLPQFLERYWRRALAEEAKVAQRAAQEEAKAVARDIAGRVRRHQKFTASLAKHTKALAALAH